MKKNPYIKYVVIFIVITVIAFIAVGVPFALHIAKGPDTAAWKTYYDGISDEDLCSLDRYWAYKKSTRGYSKDSLANSRVSIGEFYGLITVSSSRVKDATIEITVNSTLNSGELRIFVIRNDSEILTEIPPNETTTLTFVSEGSNTYTVKILGYAANIKIEVDSTSGA